MALPALRNLDVTPIEQDGQPLLCFRDPEGYVEEQLVLSPHAFFVAAHLDGEQDVTDIQYAFAQQFGGRLLMTEQVMEVVQSLDEHGFLQSERFYAIRDAVQQAFAEAPVRRAYLAGKAYPGDPVDLRAFLEQLFTHDDGPGEAIGEACVAGAPLRGLIVPHIDFERGGPTYAHGYLRLARHGKPGTVFIFGVAHTGGPAPFILTRKAFETPFGLVETDADIVDRLANACSWDPFEHEIVHRTEHSIEFQTLLLAYLYGSDLRIVPILCGHASEDPAEDDLSGMPEVARFLEACRDHAAPPDNRVAAIAAADLSHVGRRFGDAFDIDAGVIRRVEARDREDLEHVTALDADGWYRSVMRDGNARQVCGLGCIYATLKTIEGSVEHGEMLHYGHGPDPAGGIVSFAGIAFPAKA